MSAVSYTMLTGYPIEELWSGKITPEWRAVANNVAAQIAVRSLLFDMPAVE